MLECIMIKIKEGIFGCLCPEEAIKIRSLLNDIQTKLLGIAESF